MTGAAVETRLTANQPAPSASERDDQRLASSERLLCTTEATTRERHRHHPSHAARIRRSSSDPSARSVPPPPRVAVASGLLGVDLLRGWLGDSDRRRGEALEVERQRERGQAGTAGDELTRRGGESPTRGAGVLVLTPDCTRSGPALRVPEIAPAARLEKPTRHQVQARQQPHQRTTRSTRSSDSSVDVRPSVHRPLLVACSRRTFRGVGLISPLLPLMRTRHTLAVQRRTTATNQ
jgi:hypothetical protein